MESERIGETKDLLGRLNGVVESGNGDGNDKQPLFVKLLTPSDVGKLNRLVLPKEAAEKCFLLRGDQTTCFIGSSSSSRKETLLCFEDADDGKKGLMWRFRYSYWTSSQTYVLTRGWSRFVKAKRLAVGDYVVFYSHRYDAGRLFIGFRKRDEPHIETPPAMAISTTAAAEQGDEDPQPSKKLRLFGVELEYQPQPQPQPQRQPTVDHRQSEPTSSTGSSSLPTDSQ